MSDNPLNPEQLQMRVDASKMPNVPCVICGNLFFEEVVIVKKASALQAPAGSKGFIPVGVLVCKRCQSPFDPDTYDKALKEMERLSQKS